MSIRKDEVQLEISFITDEGKQMAKAINQTKELQQGVSKLQGQITAYEKELKKANLTEERRAELLQKIKVAEAGVEDGLKKIAAAGKGVEKLDFSKVAPAQLVQRAKQLAQAMALVPQSTPQFKEMEAELGQINGQLGTLRQRAKGLSDVTPRGGGGLLSAVIGVAGGIGLVDVISKVKQLFTDSLKFFNIAQKGEAQLQAVLKSTSGIAGRSIEQLQAQSALLQEITNFDDDATQASQGLLLTFTNVRTEIFDRTIPTIQDMATAMATASGEEVNLEKTTIQVGKALNDPIKGITALSKVGVTFTEQQKEQIKVLTQSGEIVKAQTIILNELQKEFGGSAAAAAKADIGFTQLTNKFENLLEKVGGLIATGLNPLIAAGDGLIDFFDDMIGATGRASEATAVLQAAFNAEIETLKQGNISQENRKILIEQINTKYKDYLPNLITEQTSISELTIIQTAANKAFEQKILLMATEEQFVEVTKKLNTEKRKELELEISLNRERQRVAKGGAAQAFFTGSSVPAIESAIQANKKAQEELRSELDLTMKAAEEMGLSLANAIGGNKPPTSTDTETPGSDPKAVAERVKAEQDARMKALEESYKLEQLLVENQQIKHELTEQQAAERLYQLEKSYLDKRLGLYYAFGQGKTVSAQETANQLAAIQQFEADRATAAAASELLRLQELGIKKLDIERVTLEMEKESKKAVLEYTQKTSEQAYEDYRNKSEKQQQAAQELAQRQADIAGETFEALGLLTADFFLGQKKDQKQFLKDILKTLLSALQKQVLVGIANAAISETSKPFPANLFTTAAKVAAINVAFGAAKAAVSSFAEGGYTGQRITGQPNITPLANGDNMLAYVRTGEVILNEGQQRALGGPDVFRRIGVPGFADGGAIPNTTPTAATVYPAQGDQAGLMEAKMMRQEMMMMRREIGEWQRNLRVYVPYTDIEDVGTNLNGLRAEASI